MIKKLSVLLLIFIAAVGLSSVASALPINSDHSGTYQGDHPKWVVVNKIITARPRFIVNMYKSHYPPPDYKITYGIYYKKMYQVTVWMNKNS